MRIGVIGTGVVGSVFIEGVNGTFGIEIRGFDRMVSAAHADAGTGLNVGPNALKILRLHMRQRHDALRAASWPWRRWYVGLADGTTLMDLDLLEVADEPGMLIRWSELYRILREKLGETTTLDRELEALEEDAAGRLVPVFRNAAGALIRDGGFDLLVAGDGRYSRLRALANGVPAPDFPGIGTWRLLVPPTVGPIAGYGQYFNGNSRLLSFRLPGDYVYVAGSFPLTGSDTIPAAIKTVAAQRAWFLPPTAPPCQEVAWMLDMMERYIDELHWARTQDVSPLHRALDDRVMLLGDAAHTVVQTLGQGATQAIEDGVVAAALVRERPVSRTALMDAYEQRRGARIDFVRRFSRDASDTLLPGGDPVAGTLEKTGPAFREKLRRLYTDVA